MKYETDLELLNLEAGLETALRTNGNYPLSDAWAYGEWPRHATAETNADFWRTWWYQEID